MSVQPDMLYLSDAEVTALGLTARDVRSSIQEAFVAYGDGRLRCEPKTSIWLGPGHAFQSLSAVDTQRGYAALKWIGMVPPGGLAKTNINATILLSDAQTGALRCLMDARLATALRTAGMTAVAAQYLARSDSATIGFIGAGVQAESHLLALADALPSLKNVLVNSRSKATAQRFVDGARRAGLQASAATAEETVSSSDVVVTSVPIVPDFKPFVEVRWLKAGTFVAAVDLGRSWLHDDIADVELTVVDEEKMRTSAAPGNLVPPLEHAEATLSDLATGRHGGRKSSLDRTMFFSSGSGVADLAIATLIYEEATKAGFGTCLPQ